MPSIWRIRKIKDNYYLYHGDEYVGPLEKIVEEWRRGRDSNPRAPNGAPALKAGPLDRSGTPAQEVVFAEFMNFN